MNDARSTPSSGAARAARTADVATVKATIEGSSILVPAPPAAGTPCQFDTVDIEILEWIASHGRGKRRRSGWLM